MVYLADCVELMRLMPPSCVDVVFADPPYRLSGGGVTVKSGRIASVDKGGWDRSLGSFEKDHEWNVRWLHEARRVLKPDGTLWVSGTHHIIFSLGFALQSLGFRIINQIAWVKPDPPPNALHTAFTHAHETLIWASREKGARHTFNYDLVNSPDPNAQVSSVWRIPTVPRVEKLHGYHPTQKPLRLVRRALLASTCEGDLVFDPFAGSGTTAVAAKELNRAFVGTELEEEFAELAAQRIRTTNRGALLREISEQFWGGA
ncbi:MAG: DNA modification methyltransferase [uncultured Rubrobacteraceae bacterium]|uniref:Methyltransferase n=1 Tax=uncultured Rubrobacteraceae bacterium TaxID=349277 RepID=A0A6J4PTP7_9ACTN|nr:MAG: DNA modification methyltransferase [uncultured Rubrobacteraceae bacterium]